MICTFFIWIFREYKTGYFEISPVHAMLRLVVEMESLRLLILLYFKIIRGFKTYFDGFYANISFILIHLGLNFLFHILQ